MANSAKKVYNTKYRLIRADIRYRRNSMFNHKYWKWDCGLLSVDYGSETTGYIWTINSGMNFFFWHNCKANTHIFLYVYLNFLPVLHIVNSLKITKTLMYSVLTKGIRNKTGCKASTMAKWQIDLIGQNFDKPN